MGRRFHIMCDYSLPPSSLQGDSCSQVQAGPEIVSLYSPINVYTHVCIYVYVQVCCVALLCCLFDLACFFLPSYTLYVPILLSSSCKDHEATL